ncbi:hypothetical protein OWV82_010726 [Melia azedarach]|uniref:Uncharacterized protein n=1 Tax=Melia azedarach TaxID=155640 RepID=A0ACC1Y638_MELAZ|nr:hypothetical protein OWV82_010726 [Melia azedarach]
MSKAGESEPSFIGSEATAAKNTAPSLTSRKRDRRYKNRAGRHHFKTTGESSRIDRDYAEEGGPALGKVFFLDNELTSMTEDMLAQLRRTYNSPSSVKLSLPNPGFKPSQPGSGEVVVHRRSFEYGLRLLVQPFFV